MSVRPVRLQLSRGKGFNLQALSMATNGLPAVNIARPTKWGNPFRIGAKVSGKNGAHAMTRAEAIENYRLAMARMGTSGDREHRDSRAEHQLPDLATIRRELRGKNLACWCGPGPCHADILLALANP